MNAVTRSDQHQEGFRVCPYCQVLFEPKRKHQEFCVTAHRMAFHLDKGAQGKVAGVTRLKHGVSVVVHYPDGPAAERAIALRKGDVTSIVKV